MSAFDYREGHLHCEDLSLEEIAASVGTPCYVYSHRALESAFLDYSRAFASVPHLIAFAVKASPNLALLRILSRAGAGADVVSDGELHRALRARMQPEQIVFAGVGKTEEEIRAALQAGILMLCVESSQELALLDRIAGDLNLRAPVALRVNPDIDARTHPYISTGMKENKFGMGVAEALSQYEVAAGLPNIEVVGIHSHIGSQITELAPLTDALARVLELIETLREKGIDIRNWDIGGGIGISYHDESPPTPNEAAQAFLPHLEKSGCRIILEPGRSIAGAAGALLSRVLYTKESEARKFVVVDAGMTELIRPSLYDAWHEILPVRQGAGPRRTVDVVGPICETGDFLAKQRALPALEPGDLLAVMDAGAYGFAMATNYNARPRPPEILVHGDACHVIRKRETLDDLLRGEQIPAFLDD